MSSSSSPISSLRQAFPLSKTLDFRLPSKWYRRGVGAAEIVCGAALLALPHGYRRTKNAANW